MGYERWLSVGIYGELVGRRKVYKGVGGGVVLGYFYDYWEDFIFYFFNFEGYRRDEGSILEGGIRNGEEREVREIR